MTKSPIIPQDAANERFARALQLRVGLGRLHSFASVAEVSKLPERNIRAYAREEMSPPLHAVLSLFSALGPGFASDVLGLAQMDAAATEHDQPEHRRALTGLTRMATALSEALEDGRVDHVEAAGLRASAQAVIDLLAPIAAMPMRGAVPMRGQIA